MTIEELKKHINGLITDNTTTEQAEQIGAILNGVDEMQQNYDTLAQSKAELNKKYVQAIKQNSFAMQEQSKDQNKAMTLEECVEAVLKERK